MAAIAETPALLPLSAVIGSALLDPAGERIGTVEDLIVRLGDAGYPPIMGLLVKVAGREAFLPADQIGALSSGCARLTRSRLDLRRFERRESEVLLRKDVLDRQLINVDGARLVRANDIELARIGGWWRVVGVETNLRAAARRLLPRRFAARVEPRELLDWASVEPFVGHVPSVRLRVPHPKLAKLHPAQIADLVEAASHSEGEEIIEAVEADSELEADVFQELDPHHQLEFTEDRSDAEIAAMLARMDPDDAADLAAEFPEERVESILALLPIRVRRRIRSLLGYDPTTAGGLMSPDFLCLYRQATAAEALERAGRVKMAAASVMTIFTMSTRQVYEGGVQLADLLRADPRATLGELAKPLPSVAPETEFDAVARLIADYNLNAAPVVEDGHMVGVVTVDDVLEALLPRSWRRRFGVLGEG